METVTKINKLLFIMICCLSVSNLIKTSERELESKSDIEAERVLIRAIQDGNTPGALQVIEDGVSPNARDEFNCPVLVLASQKGQQGVVSGLLEDLYSRLERQRESLFQQLDGKIRDLDDNDNDEDRAAIELLDQRISFLHRRMNILRGKKRKKVDVNATDSLGCTALSHSIERGSLSLVQQLLKAGAAIKRCYMEMEGLTDDIREALQAVVDRRTPQLMSQLEIALSHATFGEVGRLLEEVDVNTPDKNGATPLMVISGGDSVKKEDVEATLQVLLKNGGDLEVVDKRGWTPLIWAAHYGKGGVVPGLLEAGAIVNTTDKERRTALDHAAIQGETGVVKQLISAEVPISKFIMGRLSFSLGLNSDVREVLQDEVARRAALEQAESSEDS